MTYTGTRPKTAKLSDEDVKWIRENYKPYSHGDTNLPGMAKKFNVTPMAIRAALKGLTYPHVEARPSTYDRGKKAWQKDEA